MAALDRSGSLLSDYRNRSIMNLKTTTDRPYAYTCHFDFDIGYLVQSPCRGCDQSEDLPICSQACLLLDRIRGLLADVVPCTQRW